MLIQVYMVLDGHGSAEGPSGSIMGGNRKVLGPVGSLVWGPLEAPIIKAAGSTRLDRPTGLPLESIVHPHRL